MPPDLSDPLDLLARAVSLRPPRQVSAREPEERAAVSIVARPDGGVLFIRRSEREGDPWSGHMAFPGGRMEVVDATSRHAANRVPSPGSTSPFGKSQ